MMVLVLLLSLLVGSNDTPLLESGQAATIRKQTSAPTEIKVITYNIRWRSGDDLQTMIKLLQEDPEIGCASILALQEVDRHKKRTGHHNTVKTCLLYTSDAADERSSVDLGGRRI